TTINSIRLSAGDRIQFQPISGLISITGTCRSRDSSAIELRADDATAVRIALLAEGDPESMVASFSGLTKSLVDGLRRRGDEVYCGDADLYGWRRIMAALPAWSPNRKRWSVRYHALPIPRALRSARADAVLSQLPTVDAVVQVGGTFVTSEKARAGRPYFTFCDSNIAMATRGR